MIDAFNVIGSRPSGWWRDRDRAVRDFVLRLRQLAAEDDVELTIAIDGTPLDGLPEGADGLVTLLYATRRGPNAADDRIIAAIEEQPHPSTLLLITADRELTRRAQVFGVTVGAPRILLERLDELASTNPE